MRLIQSFLKVSTLVTTAFAAMVLSLPVSSVEAADILVQCEKRSNRSKVSVDGNNLIPSNYSAKITSGSNTKISAYKPSVGDEIGFDFDSDRNDVAAGAIRISSSFIQNGQVTGELINEKDLRLHQVPVLAALNND
ncbi:MAG: hypothetical protein IPJ05_04520 [Nitrosomonas sp.]|nr:hypothetical protein [Nitrosomonas sp.]